MPGSRVAASGWTTHIARIRAPLDELVHELDAREDPGGLLVIARSAESRTRWRRALGPRHHVLTLAQAFGLLSPAGIEEDDLLPSVVSHWAILDSLPEAIKGPHRTHLAHEHQRAVAILESNAMRPPYPRGVRARLERGDRVLVDAHEAFSALRAQQNELGRYTPDQRVTEMAHATESEVRARLAQRMPTVATLVVTDVAWMSPAERAALDRLGRAIGHVVACLVARPLDADPDEWAALAHCDSLRDHLAARGPIQDHVVGPDNARALRPRVSDLQRLAAEAPLVRGPLHDVHLDRPRNRAEEVRRAAVRIHDLIASGTEPHRIALVAADLERYLGPVRHELTAHQIPASLRHHGHTLHTPAGTLLALLLLDALEADLDRDTVLDWMMHPLVSVWGDHPDTARGKLRFRPHHIADALATRGLRPRGLSGEDGWDAALDALLEPSDDDMRQAAQRGEDPPPVPDWMRVHIHMTRDLVQRLDTLRRTNSGQDFLTQLRDLLAHIHLPANVQRYAARLPDPQPLLVGYRQLVHLLDRIEDAYAMAPPRGTQRAAAEVRNALRHGLRTLELPLGGDPEHGVQVVGWRNAPDLDVDHVLVLGATDDALPPRDAQQRIVRRLRTHLGPDAPLVHIRPEPEARYILHRILADSTGTVTFSCPRQDNGDPVNTSTLLDELEDAYELGPAPDVTHRILSASAWHEHQARHGLVPDDPHHVRAGAVASARITPGAPAAHTGALTTETLHAHPMIAPVAGRQPISAKRLETFARCGFRALIEHGLTLKRPMVRDQDLPNLDRGNLLHDILDAYARDGMERHGTPFRPTGADEDERLYDIGTEQFLAWRRQGPVWDAFAITLLGGLDTPKNPYRNHPPGLLRRVLDDLRDLPPGDGILASEAAFGSDDATAVEIQVGTQTIALRGRIDRIDHRATTGTKADTPGLSVLDYKSGKAPTASGTHGGIDLQLPLYLLAAEVLHPDHHPHEGAYYSLRNPRQRDSTQGYGIRVKGKNTTRINRADDPDAFDHLLRTRTRERLTDMLEAERHGRFPITWLDPDEAGCRHCDVRRMCGMDPERQPERRLAGRTLAKSKAPSETGYVPDLTAEDPAHEEDDA